MVAETPNMTPMLKMFEPTMFPIAISPCPLSVAFRLTTSSGALVPNSTMVRPITKGEILALRAKAELP